MAAFNYPDGQLKRILRCPRGTDQRLGLVEDIVPSGAVRGCYQFHAFHSATEGEGACVLAEVQNKAGILAGGSPPLINSRIMSPNISVPPVRLLHAIDPLAHRTEGNKVPRQRQPAHRNQRC